MLFTQVLCRILGFMGVRLIIMISPTAGIVHKINIGSLCSASIHVKNKSIQCAIILLECVSYVGIINFGE